MLGQWGYPDWLRFLKIATPMTSSLCASMLSRLMWPTSVWMVKLCHMCDLCVLDGKTRQLHSPIYWHNIPLYYELGLTVWHQMVISHNDMHSLLPGQNSVVSWSSLNRLLQLTSKWDCWWLWVWLNMPPKRKWNSSRLMASKLFLCKLLITLL